MQLTLFGRQRGSKQLGVISYEINYLL